MSETRKLAAILVADVVGYSRLTSADEDQTLARLRSLRSDLIDPTISVHHGRVVKRTGDGALVEFRSVVDALRCAIELQRSMVERNAGVPEDRRIEFRIGIHVGDVVEESDGDLMGDGVNIAARLEGICEPGGVCVSGAAHDQVLDRVKETFIDLGEKALKNIARPVRAYRIALGQSGALSAPAREQPSRLTLPDKPSIAVLPFQNMSGDPEQDYFADGMVEDIITGLSRIKWFFVIARNSSFVYKGKAVDIRQVGRELGVRYVLEGSVRKAGARLRVTAQLVEAESGAHLWADKFDGDLIDVFDFQDQITDRVVGIVEPNVQKSELDRSRRKPPESLDAYDLYLRALPYVSPISAANAQIAAEYLQKALKLEPNYAAAHAYVAWALQIHFTHGGGFDEAEKMAALQHARAATAHDVDDATALAVGAMVLNHFGNDPKDALNAIKRALSSNPSSAIALYFGAELHGWYGDFVTATAYADRALRLSPFDPLAYVAHVGLAIAAVHEGRYEESAAQWAECARVNPGLGTFLMAQAWALALAGRLDQGKRILSRALELEPGLCIRTIVEAGFPPAVAERAIHGGRLLGLPELSSVGS
jgi:TolB-like protein/class 3 adenylate cyclase